MKHISMILNPDACNHDAGFFRDQRTDGRTRRFSELDNFVLAPDGALCVTLEQRERVRRHLQADFGKSHNIALFSSEVELFYIG